MEGTADAMSVQQACVLLQIMIYQWRINTVALNANMPLRIFKIDIKGLSSRYNNQQNQTDLLVSLLTERRGGGKRMILLILYFID